MDYKMCSTYFSKRANEVLSFDLQVPLAKLLGFQKIQVY